MRTCPLSPESGMSIRPLGSFGPNTLQEPQAGLLTRGSLYSRRLPILPVEYSGVRPVRPVGRPKRRRFHPRIQLRMSAGFSPASLFYRFRPPGIVCWSVLYLSGKCVSSDLLRESATYQGYNPETKPGYGGIISIIVSNVDTVSDGGEFALTIDLLLRNGMSQFFCGIYSI